MNLSLRSLVFVVASVAALPFAACGGNVTGPGGGGAGGEGAGSGMCAAYCASQLACLTPGQCVLVDAAAAKSTCEAACDKGLGVLDAAELTAFQGCFDCLFANVGAGTCFENLPIGSCEAACNSDAVEAAGEKWEDASEPPSGDTSGLCTNGQDLFQGGECGASSDGTSCTLECCNGTCGAVPDVAVSCVPDGAATTCTCTAGKNKGKTYSSAEDCGSDELWNQCNL